MTIFRGGKHSSVMVEIYSTVWEGLKENQECTNSTYFLLCLQKMMFLTGTIQHHVILASACQQPDSIGLGNSLYCVHGGYWNFSMRCKKGACLKNSMYYHSFLQDTPDFLRHIEEIKTEPIPSGCFPVSIDVVGLYSSNIPLEEGIQ